MPDQSEAPIVRKLREQDGPDLMRTADEAAEIIRLCVEALEEVRKCGNGGARLTRTASDMVRRALAQIKGQNP